MAKIRREKLPRALIQHLSLRIRQRQISVDQMGLFGEWCDTNPEVPEGEWFKRFPGMIVCGEGEGKNVPRSRTSATWARDDLRKPHLTFVGNERRSSGMWKMDEWIS